MESSKCILLFSLVVLVLWNISWALLLTILAISVPLYRISIFHPLHGYPGPLLRKTTQLTMLYFVLRGTSHEALKALHAQYGRIVQTGPNSVSFLSTAAIRTIYSSSNALNKSSAYDIRRMEGEALFFMKDRTSRTARRKVWTRSFSDQAMAQYHKQLVLEVEHLIRCLLQKTDERGKVDLVKILPRYAYDSINTIFFSGTAFPSLLDSEDPDEVVAGGSDMFALTEIFSHIQPLFRIISWIPGISLRFEKLLIAAAERRLKNGPDVQDGISYWFDGEESQPKMSPGDLAIENGVILIGGADTTAGILIFLFQFLMADPKWIKLLREELCALNHEAPTQWLHSLDQTVVLNAIIQESLRLGTPFPGFPRVVPKGGIEIDGHYVPGGTTVSVPGWAYHLNEEVFSNPNAFNPERWIEDGKFTSTKATLLAFSGGPFGCVGQRLVWVQLRLLLAILVLQVDIIPEPGFSMERFWKGVRNRRATTFRESLWVKVVSLGV